MDISRRPYCQNMMWLNSPSKSSFTGVLTQEK